MIFEYSISSRDIHSLYYCRFDIHESSSDQQTYCQNRANRNHNHDELDNAHTHSVNSQTTTRFLESTDSSRLRDETNNAASILHDKSRNILI